MIYANDPGAVLVVDDEPLVLKYSVLLIGALGFQRIFKAVDAQNARRIVDAEQIALFIMDVSLPDADGREIAGDLLRKNPAAAGILMTGFAADELQVPPELQDRLQLLEKPFTAEDLENAVADVTRGVRQPLPICRNQ